MKQKLLFALVFVCLGILLCGMTVSAATEGYYTYEISNGEATITDCNTSISGNVAIPSKLGGCPVTEIGSSAFSGCKILTNIRFPDSLISIGAYAFYNCTSLISITIPDSVTFIGDQAFYGCSSLVNIAIPDNVESIGDAAFVGTIYYSNEENWENDVLYIGHHLIRAKENIVGAITIKEGTICIADNAFSWCESLTNVTLPDSVTFVGRKTFFKCEALTSINLPDSIIGIAALAFEYCSELTEVYITDIGAYLKIAYGSDSAHPMYYADELYLNGEKIVDLSIPDGITKIPAYAFRNCDSLTSVSIPASVIAIADYAFYNCTGLTEVYITDIAAWCKVSFGNMWGTPLSYAKKLYLNHELVTDLVIPDGVTVINDRAFTNCSRLTNIKIPDSVTSIGSYAFNNCSRLTNVNIPDSVISIGEGAFRYCTGLSKVDITDIIAWCDIHFADSNANPLSAGGNLYISNKTVKELVIPSSVTSIADYAFCNCGNLTSITILDGVTAIGNSAFRHCSSLMDVSMGNSVTTIGEYAFYYCENLQTVVIPKNITEIEAGAFSGCNEITTVEYGGSENDWAEMYIGDNNGSLLTAQVNYGYVLPLVISYDGNDGTGILETQKADGNSELTVLGIEPNREGYLFLGWATDSNARLAEYQAGDILKVADKNITLYAVWKRIVSLQAEIINNIFIITPDNVPKNSPILFACYQGNRLVCLDSFLYQGSAVVPFTAEENYDSVKVMVWENLENCVPLCKPETVAFSQTIELLMME